jgi:hypothetical protein
MLYDADRVARNVIRADLEDLLDRVTAYRAGMEPAAIASIEEELEREGVTNQMVREYEDWCRRNVIYLDDGTAAKCTFCYKPAVQQGWGWYRWSFSLPWLRRVIGERGWLKRFSVPVFPCHVRRCIRHGGVPSAPAEPGA